MPSSEAVSGGVDLAAARRTWRLLEPYHSMIYFSPDAASAYEALGIDQTAGYFASRAAALGPVPSEVVTATFYNFNPELVRAAIPRAWEAASPTQILAARTAAADATLRQVLGNVVDSPEVVRAAELARHAAEAVAGDVAGRTLYAAHAALPWPEGPPHLVLWHAQTLLREYRGDGHLAGLLTTGLSGIEALVAHAATGRVRAKGLRTTRGWSEDDWTAAVDRLRERGWLTAGPELALTPEGQQWRDQLEQTTDQRALAPYAALGAAGCAELRALTPPLARPLAEKFLPWMLAEYDEYVAADAP